jgi:hypothetical protein
MALNAGQPFITMDTRNLERRLAVLRKVEIPSAIRNTLNDLAFDTRKRMVTEIQKVFDRPTPIVQRLPRVEKATKTKLNANLFLTDFYGGNTDRRSASYALVPHMTGQPNARGRKGLELRLERMGRITAGEWLMPGKAAKLDAYGNVSGSEISKMIADIGAYNQYAGDAANTKAAKLAKRKDAGRYIWVRRKGLTKSGARGIYRKVGTQLLPVMVVVSKAPRYAKRFRWQEVASSYVARRTEYHARRAIAQAISKRG